MIADIVAMLICAVIALLLTYAVVKLTTKYLYPNMTVVFHKEVNHEHHIMKLEDNRVVQGKEWQWRWAKNGKECNPFMQEQLNHELFKIRMGKSNSKEVRNNNGTDNYPHLEM